MWCRETMGMFGEARPRFLYLSLSSPPPLSLPPSLSLLQTAIASFLPALTPPPPRAERADLAVPHAKAPSTIHRCRACLRCYAARSSFRCLAEAQAESSTAAAAVVAVVAAAVVHLVPTIWRKGVTARVACPGGGGGTPHTRGMRGGCSGGVCVWGGPSSMSPSLRPSFCITLSSPH